MTWRGEGRALEAREQEGDDYIHETDGDLTTLDDDDDSQTVPVGKFHLYYVDANRALNEGVAVFDVLDTYSETIDYFEALYGSESPEIKERIGRLLDEDAFMGSNVLIVDRLEILPKYRGRSIGLFVMRELIARFSMGAVIVAIKPFPLQFEGAGPDDPAWRGRMQLGELIGNERAATAKLRAHYSKLGFILLRGTPFMVRSTDLPLA
jgi:GNAT superfamily N-acetyltransferase